MKNIEERLNVVRQNIEEEEILVMFASALYLKKRYKQTTNPYIADKLTDQKGSLDGLELTLIDSTLEHVITNHASDLCKSGFILDASYPGDKRPNKHARLLDELDRLKMEVALDADLIPQFWDAQNKADHLIQRTEYLSDRLKCDTIDLITLMKDASTLDLIPSILSSKITPKVDKMLLVQKLIKDHPEVLSEVVSLCDAATSEELTSISHDLSYLLSTRKAIENTAASWHSVVGEESNGKFLIYLQALEEIELLDYPKGPGVINDQEMTPLESCLAAMNLSESIRSVDAIFEGRIICPIKDNKETDYKIIKIKDKPKY